MICIKRKLIVSLCGLAVLLLFTSCTTLDLATPFDIMKKDIPIALQKSSIEYSWTKQANSSYGYEQLDGKEKSLYTQLVKAWFDYEDSIIIKQKITKAELLEVSELVFHDYPEISWVERHYTCQTTLSGATKVAMKYSMNEARANSNREALERKTASLLKDISPSLSDFEKASRAHDKLINLVTYDKEAEFPSEAYGAIVQGRATCLGYAKAYQLMLLKMGIEALVIYGDADELHAWNYVKLGDSFYFVDATFDDAKMQDEMQYISRAYLFLNDEQSFKTHRPLNNGGYKKLPLCNKTAQNYFVQKKLMIDSESIKKNIFNKLLKKTAKTAIEQRAETFQVKAESAEIAKKIETDFLAKGTADVAVNSAALTYRGVRYIGRAFDDKTNVYTFVLSYSKMA